MANKTAKGSNMSQLLIPSDTIDQMVCIMCQKHLSFFPVHVKEDGSGAICGRCKLTDGDTFLRDKAYESIAHAPRKDCTKCTWQGTCANLKDHFEKNHSKLLIVDAQFEINFLTSFKEKALLIFTDEHFIVHREVDLTKENFIFSVKHLKSNDTSESYCYFLQLLSGDKTYSCRLPKQATTGESNSITKFSNSFIKEKLHDADSVLIKINIIGSDVEIPELEEECISIVKDVKKDPNINWGLLSELECPVCFEYMLPPIHQCVNGHSLCSVCKGKITLCPLCKCEIQETKNFVLEKMTLYLVYPCKYYKSGCEHSGKSTEIRSHEENCEFGPVSCPLKGIENCQWMSNISGLLSHVEKEHSASMLKSVRIDIRFDETSDIQQTFLLKFSEKVFMLCFKYSDKKFRWAMQLMGTAAECEKYRFEIDIIDNSMKKRRCYMRGVCVPFKENIEGLTDPCNYLMMTLEQIKPLITVTFSYQTFPIS
ncbi:hypothetical protein NQ318_004741 [Aromia moschata]|uniref:E3 ubiquitin-protein ligase n=1 Tax=Aromia moschata TaxID=1265417 RepID=A0AAV8XW02_9CUCU|nr:hypothetical protein NQ318_004741 [Aromia moschata]